MELDILQKAMILDSAFASKNALVLEAVESLIVALKLSGEYSAMAKPEQLDLGLQHSMVGALVDLSSTKQAYTAICDMAEYLREELADANNRLD